MRNNRLEIFYKNFFIYLLCFYLVFQPVLAQAGTVHIPGFAGPTVATPAAATLPVLKPGTSTPGILNIKTPSVTSMVIHQNQPKAIIDWQSFNISSDSSVHFDQQGNTNWAALNRIWDKNPSLIFGTLTADGKIYLINQNGILFGPGSQVNVNTLVASALNMTNDNFLNDIYKYKLKSLVFQQENYQKEDDPARELNPLATVSNHGAITTTDGGSVFLIASRVDNAGLISAPLGQTGLVAGTIVTLAKSDFGYYVVSEDDVNNPAYTDPSFGRAVNLEGGELRADGGRAGMYGNNVDQWGIIRSITAFQNKQGIVELRAANKVTTGEKSVIMLPVDASLDPETGKIVTVNDSYIIQPIVNIQGLDKWNTSGSGIATSKPARQIEHRGVIAAPTGNVTLSAAGRVYLDRGSLIDVSGVKYMANLKDGASVGVNSYRPADVIAASVKDAALPASALSIKLNSVELRDAYGQKDGILQGTKITTSSESGSSVGDLSSLILTQERTAIERSIGGARRTVIDQREGAVTYNNPQTGNINIQSADDIIFKQGAGLDVSGGSIRYESGSYTPTKLVSGMKVYDIAGAPLSLAYDKILGTYTKTYERYGVRENYAGYYYGSSFAQTYMEGFARGGDAGAISLTAPVMILDGAINGGVTAGIYQTAWTMPGSYTGSDFDAAMSLSVRRGLETPRAGTLTIDTSYRSNDSAIPVVPADSSIAVVAAATPSADILPETPLDIKTTEISAQIINNAKLGALTLKTNNIISTASDVEILLAPGGIFSAYANRIEHSGKITVHSGQINLTLDRNTNTSLLNTGKIIILGPDSLLDVSGERINNSLARGSGVPLRYGQTTGGKIQIYDATEYGEGVDMQSGAVVDVSGGYTIDQKGKITGGHAGILDIQGSNIALGGDLRGYALADTNGKILGGALTLRTNKNILVASSAESAPDDTLVITPGRFADTGFTQITLNSRNNVTVAPDAVFRTSLTRLKNPTPTLQGEISEISAAQSGAVSGHDLIRLQDYEAYMAGPSTFTLQAAKEFLGATIEAKGFMELIDPGLSNWKVVVSSGAAIRTAPAVASVTRVGNDGAASVTTGITLGGPYVEMAGTLESRGGAITLEAKNQTGSVTLSSGARINARGYNRPDPSSTPKGFALNYLPAAGGAVKLTAAGTGDIILEERSEIDVSGDRAVETRMKTTDGKTYAFREAGAPGSLTLSYGGEFTWAGTVKAGNPYADSEGIKTKGGTLTVNQTQKEMNIGAEDIQRYTGAGFDDVTLKAFGAIQFTGAIGKDAGKIGRKLTLGARQIHGAGQDVNLSAPWIVLTNHNVSAGSLPDGSETGELKLTAKNGWIDVIGDVGIGGFANVTLTAGQDIRLSQARYNDYTNPFRGLFAATGNLTLDANRIYPGSIYDYTSSTTDYTGYYSTFTVSAEGKITVLNSSGLTASPVYSAGGSLTIKAGEGIEVQTGAYIAAPLGTIKLSSPGGRIYLAQGSALSTVGAGDMPVKYGYVDSNNNWMAQTDLRDSASSAAVNLNTFSKSVALDAGTGEVIIRNGATIDVSGGGGAFNYQFQPGVAGSEDPLLKSGRYLVFKDNSLALPGSTVHLKGGAGLAEGDYAIIALNAQTAKYAFLPGAYILETQKSAALPVSGSQALTKDGYPLIYGYAGVAGTPVSGTRPQVYSVRKAADVIKTEGDYIRPSLISGNSGNVTINGQTSIIEGTISAKPWTTDYLGGTISLSAGNIFVQKDVGSLFSGGFNDPIAGDYKNKLYLSFDSLSNKGFKEVSLGDTSSTGTVTIEGGNEGAPTELTASIISLAAKDKITISPYAHLYAQTSANEASGEGKVSLATTGTLLIDENAEVRATHLISLDVNNVEGIRGNLQVDQSAIELKSANIYFGETTASGATGLHITPDVWSRFSGFENITFTGKKDIQFLGDTSLSAPGRPTRGAGGGPGI
jgi:filamentous hemagglutinin